MKTKVILIAAAGLIAVGGALHSGHLDGCPLKRMHSEKASKTVKVETGLKEVK